MSSKCLYLLYKNFIQVFKFLQPQYLNEYNNNNMTSKKISKSHIFDLFLRKRNYIRLKEKC